MTDKPKGTLGTAGQMLRSNVKRIREGQKLTYVELSERLTDLGRPVPVLGLRRIERGERRVDVDDLIALAAAFGVEPMRLLQESLTVTVTIGSHALIDRLAALKPPTDGLTEDFLSDLAAAYRELVIAKRAPAPAIAEQTGAPVRTVHGWIAEARKRNYLPAAMRGRAG